MTLDYQDYDQEVFEAFVTPFNFSLSGYAEEDIEITVDAVADATTHYLKEVYVNLHAEDSVAGVSIDVDVEYTNHNEIEDFGVEEEAFEDVGE